jgi:hypothetical protein
MRTIGQCELALELMAERALERMAFGKHLSDFANVQDWIAMEPRRDRPGAPAGAARRLAHGRGGQCRRPHRGVGHQAGDGAACKPAWSIAPCRCSAPSA